MASSKTPKSPARKIGKKKVSKQAAPRPSGFDQALRWILGLLLLLILGAAAVVYLVPREMM